ncbi:hypothetical protein CPB85DRAFT_493048 [Mucidula mucida]|nr:hypothetical protein CPB85DRAFT_493048 [Mucidula mucida]
MIFGVRTEPDPHGNQDEDSETSRTTHEAHSSQDTPIPDWPYRQMYWIDDLNPNGDTYGTSRLYVPTLFCRCINSQHDTARPMFLITQTALRLATIKENVLVCCVRLLWRTLL